MIRKAKHHDLDALDRLSERVVRDMHDNNLHQWTRTYPRKEHFAKDIAQDALYVYEISGCIVGAMAFYEEADPPYKTVTWMRNHSMVIHRILVDPQYQRHGYAADFIDFACAYAKDNYYESVKIDTHPANYRMRHFLKKHQFVELEYIKVMHRIAFERIIKQTMNRIVVLGNSGTGKTTLARILGAKLNVPHLPLDTVYWQKNWTSLPKPEFSKIVRGFMHKFDRYVIDGNYTNTDTFMDRLNHADTIILLDYAITEAIKGITEREAKYRHRYRSDMATGCYENIDQEFLEYVYRFNPKMRRMKAIVNQFQGQKLVLTFKTRKCLMRWLDTI